MVGYAWYQLHIIYKIIIVAAQRNISTYTIAHSSGLNTKSRKSKKIKKKKEHSQNIQTQTHRSTKPTIWSCHRSMKLRTGYIGSGMALAPHKHQAITWIRVVILVQTARDTIFRRIIICDVVWIQWASESALWMEVSWFISPWHQHPQHRWSQHLSSRLPVLKLNLKHVHIWIMKFPSNCYVN